MDYDGTISGDAEAKNARIRTIVTLLQAHFRGRLSRKSVNVYNRQPQNASPEYPSICAPSPMRVATTHPLPSPSLLSIIDDTTSHVRRCTLSNPASSPSASSASVFVPEPGSLSEAFLLASSSDEQEQVREEEEVEIKEHRDISRRLDLKLADSNSDSESKFELLPPSSLLPLTPSSSSLSSSSSVLRQTENLNLLSGAECAAVVARIKARLRREVSSRCFDHGTSVPPDVPRAPSGSSLTVSSIGDCGSYVGSVQDSGISMHNDVDRCTEGKVNMLRSRLLTGETILTHSDVTSDAVTDRCCAGSNEEEIDSAALALQELRARLSGEFLLTESSPSLLVPGDHLTGLVHQQYQNQQYQDDQYQQRYLDCGVMNTVDGATVEEWGRKEGCDEEGDDDGTNSSDISALSGDLYWDSRVETGIIKADTSSYGGYSDGLDPPGTRICSVGSNSNSHTSTVDASPLDTELALLELSMRLAENSSIAMLHARRNNKSSNDNSEINAFSCGINASMSARPGADIDIDSDCMRLQRLLSGVEERFFRSNRHSDR